MTPAKIVTATQSYKSLIINNNCSVSDNEAILDSYRQVVSENTGKLQ